MPDSLKLVIRLRKPHGLCRLCSRAVFHTGFRLKEQDVYKRQMCMRAVMTIFLLHMGNRLAAPFASWLMDLQFFQFLPADTADSPAACLATEWAYFRPEPAEDSFIDFS